MKNCKKNSLLGIIGGMGPLTDAAFLHLLHQNTDCRCDQEHISVICDGNSKRPDRSNFILGTSNYSPKKSLFFSLRRLETLGCDVIVMPCNTAHFWLPFLMRKKRKRTVFIDMIRQTCRRTEANGYKKVCLLASEGCVKADLYGEHLFKMGVDLIYPEKEVQKQINCFIKSIKGGKSNCISELEPCLEKIDCDAFILGCTELSIALYADERVRFKYIDSLSCLARYTIALWGKKSKPIKYT